MLNYVMTIALKLNHCINTYMELLIDKIKRAIKGTKYENKTYVAGGYVRDKIMKQYHQENVTNSHDLDICVESPNGGIHLCQYLSKILHGTTPVIFERFGTAQTVIDGIECEFVMTRKESYDGITRNPEVVFGTIREDVFRRDFTVNSLVQNISTGEIYDYTLSGFKDIKYGIIRTTSDSDVIFEEDPLRIMRAVRFATRFGFVFDEKTYIALYKNSKHLRRISKERIRDEFMKILTCKYVDDALNHLVVLGISNAIDLHELLSSMGIMQNVYHSKDVFGHITDVVCNAKPQPLHRLAALMHDLGKIHTRIVDGDKTHFYDHETVSANIAERFMTELKFSNKDIDLVKTAVQNHMRIKETISDRKVRKIRSELGDEKFEFLLDLCEADRLAHVNADISHISRIRSIIQTEVRSEKPLISGHELIELFGLKQGPDVGAMLSKIKEFQFDNPNITKEEVVLLLKS